MSTAAEPATVPASCVSDFSDRLFFMLAEPIGSAYLADIITGIYAVNLTIMNTNPSVSLFGKLYLPVSESHSLEEIIILIRTRRWIREIIGYRQALTEGRTEDARKLKSRLPGFTPSGVFNGGHRASQLVTYSQLVGLDFDHVTDSAALAALFRKQRYTRAQFISPGGEGLKVFVSVDTGQGQHAEAFAAVATHYEQLSGLSCDRVCKDISRCCYVSDDPEACYNPEAEAFSPSSVSPGQVFVHDWLRSNTPAEGNRNHTVYRLGCEGNRRGFDSETIASFCVPLLRASDFTEAEIRQALSSAYQGNTPEHSTRPATERTETALKAPDAISGEELREHTPFLPEKLTDSLPPLLGEAIGFYTDRRERDMALLAACTVLSACLPGVWGVYNRKRVYPHLFTVEVAPAANGKGCINDMRRLADRYASLIEAETKRKEEEYRQELENWELKKVSVHRKGQPVRMVDAPVKASTCYFLIPTQITKAKLLVHLAENGEIGGLMADSEIDTLISAGKQDYGQFDDLLRKAFHHETVASSRKTDNEMIRILRPRLAVLLAGTPGQFPRLVTHVENGLISRLLLYTCRSEAVWQDVSPAGGTADFESYLDALSERVLEIALVLRKRRLQVKLASEQWGELNLHFSRLLQESDLFGCEHFLGVVKRYGLIAYRLCMIFTALDTATLAYGVDERYCSMPHFKAALSITDVCLEHSRLLMTQLEEVAVTNELHCPDGFRKIFDQLPDQFNLSDLYPLCQSINMGERAVRRYLSRLEPKFITRLSRGCYQKNDLSAA